MPETDLQTLRLSEVFVESFGFGKSENVIDVGFVEVRQGDENVGGDIPLPKFVVAVDLL